jgi:hypothetical protein
MSCVYVFKGNEYSESEFYDLIDKNKQEFFKSQTLRNNISGLRITDILSDLSKNVFAKNHESFSLLSKEQSPYLNLKSKFAIKQGVEELFESNPELANEIYEALGFPVKIKTKIDTIKTPIEIRRELLEKQERGQISLGGEDIDIISQSRSNPTEENIQKLKDLYNTEIGLLQDSIINQITPQQKQQAQQLYSQYLDTIFPDSKVKYIVYRGSIDNPTNKKSRELGIFFTDDKNAANIYAVKYKDDEFEDSIIQGIVKKFGLNPTIEQIKSEIAFFEKMGATKEQIERDAKKYQEYIQNNKGITEQVILNIENPKNLTVKDWFDNYDDSSSLKENADGLLLKGGKQSDNRIYDAGENQIVVFKPEQIHILGSKQDIENFANFVSYENSSYSKIGSIQQFRDYIMSKNFAAVEEFLVVNNKIDRKC